MGAQGDLLTASDRGADCRSWESSHPITTPLTLLPILLPGKPQGQPPAPYPAFWAALLLTPLLAEALPDQSFSSGTCL